MPEKGWYSITVRKETALMVRNLAKEQGMTVDTYINSIITEKSPKNKWIMCTLCGVRLKTENFEAHMNQRHPREKREIEF